MHGVESRRRENLRTQPLCAPHLITLQYYSLLRIFVRKLVTTFGALQLAYALRLQMSCILIVPNLSNLVFSVLVVLADTTQLGKLFNAFITVLIKPNFRKSYFACRSLQVVQRVRHLGLRSVGRGFKSCSRQRCVTTLGKLFTPMCLCHQAV